MKLFLKKILLFFNFQINKISEKEKIYSKYFFLGEKQDLNENIKKYPYCHLFEYEKFSFLLNAHSKQINKSLNLYFKKKKMWETSEGELLNNFDFVPSYIFTGSIGLYNALFSLLLAYKYGLRKKREIICIVPKNAKLNNNCLASYFKKYVRLIETSEKNFFLLKKAMPIGQLLEFEDNAVRIDEARNFINQRIKAKKFKFRLTSKHEKIGNKNLRKIGIKNNKKFVTLHIRQYGWRNETRKKSNEKHRTPNPENYLPAIKEIIRKGYKVILVGNNNYHFPKIKNFYNYADSTIKSDIMDVYLAAKAKFCVANSSGFYPISKIFGTPVLLVDAPSHTDYLHLDEQDMYLPRLFCKEGNNKKELNLKNFKYPLNSLYSDLHFKKLKMRFIENSPDELKDAVKEMFNKKRESLLQKKFKRDLSNFFQKEKYLPYAKLPHTFLEKYYRA